MKLLVLSKSRFDVSILSSLLAGLETENVNVTVVGDFIGDNSLLPSNIKLVRCTLEDYLLSDWEELIIEELEPAWTSTLISTGLGGILYMDGFDLGEMGKQSFCTRVLKDKGRVLVGVKAIIDTEVPDLIAADDFYIPYVRVLSKCPFITMQRFRPVSPLCPTGLLILLYALVGVIYKVLWGTFFAKVLQTLKGVQPSEGCYTIFFGAQHGLKNLEPFFHWVVTTQNKEIYNFRPVGRVLLNRNILSPNISYKVTYFEAFLDFRSLIRTLVLSIKLGLSVLKIWIQGTYKSSFRFRGKDVTELFILEWARFTLVYGPGAIKYFFLAKHLLRLRPKKAFFDNANSWEFNVLIQRLRDAGVVTITYNHGVVAEIMPYRCQVDKVLVSGEHDFRLLSRINGNIAEFIVYGWLAPASLESSGKEQRSLLLLTTNLPELTRDFLYATLLFIEEAWAQGKVEFEQIVIKLHPYESASHAKQVISRFPELLSYIKIEKRELHKWIHNARMAFTTASTTILDCLQFGVPTFVYLPYRLWTGGALYDLVPEPMRYRYSSELHEKIGDISAVKDAGKRLLTLYFGPNPPDPISVLARHLL